MKQRTNTKKDAKRIKSDNFTRSNREKSSIAIAILEKIMILRDFAKTFSLECKVKKSPNHTTN